MYRRAIQYIKPMEQGWTQPHIFRCDDLNTYVVKLINNPDGTGVLANEWIAGRLGSLLHLPIANSRIIVITHDLLDMYPELKKLDITSGLHIGSCFEEYGVNVGEHVDLSDCRNLHHAAGMIVFDHWINNWDRHITQANLLYLQDKQEILLIDHSDAFFGPDWDMDEWWENEELEVFWGPLYEKFAPYIDNSDPFEEYLDAIESLEEADLRNAIHGIPHQWSIPEDDLDQLVDFLLFRKDRVRFALGELIEHFPIWHSTRLED
ncbi:HipA family kinase [Paenibacillus bouchesdurhonensis]|uniref:HipA family kinase n=1 Tax=Paenibacillus bouchesdurhonensis TaxID=1870990 RepID=UPI000DA605BF|nr:HipA family kinase [Paenibacillus bouchesdurhonensis]